MKLIAKRITSTALGCLLANTLFLESVKAASATELSIYKTGEMRALRIHPSPLPLPTFYFKDTSGRLLGVQNFQGKVLVLNLWATWCAPCVKELPALDALQRIFPDGNVVVLAVSQDRVGNQVVPAFFDKLKLKNLRIYLDNKSTLMDAFRVNGLPTTIIINRSGKEVARLIGAVDWSSQEVVSLLKAIDY